MITLSVLFICSIRKKSFQKTSSEDFVMRTILLVLRYRKGREKACNWKGNLPMSVSTS